jgi:hypothetical protein
MFSETCTWARFGPCPFPGNDHIVLPDEWNERQYLDYGSLFDQLRGRKWLLKPGMARVDGGAAEVNVFETKAGTVVSSASRRGAIASDRR